MERSGTGAVYRKTLRDSRLPLAVVAGFLALHVWGGAQGMAAYGTPDARRQIADFAAAVPDALRGLYGNPAGIDALGGFIAWQFGGYLSLIVGLWSILALSGTLAGELSRGSLDLVAAAPLSRRRIALEKLAAHVTAVVAAAAFLGVVLWAVSRLPGLLPHDAIAPEAAAGFAAGVAALGLCGGALAFALGPVAGRRAAVAAAGAFMLGAYVVHAYAPSIPAFGPLGVLSPFSWLDGHLPMSGRSDWGALLFVTAVSVALFAAGVEAFARLDLAPLGIRARVPAPLLGLEGPMRRSLAEQLPLAAGWGAGIGAFGFVITAASVQFADRVRNAPDISGLARRLFPDLDISSVGGLLQVVFVEFGFLLAGLAAASFVGVWAADEMERRMDVVLSAPLGRARWAMSGLAAAFVAIGLTTALLAVAIAAGGLAAGADIAPQVFATAALALFGVTVASGGIAVGATIRGSLAAPVAAALALGTFLLDVLAVPLRAPDWVRELAVLLHMGRPMTGAWDAAGVALCLALTLACGAATAWGIRRRDLG